MMHGCVPHLVTSRLGIWLLKVVIVLVHIINPTVLSERKSIDNIVMERSISLLGWENHGPKKQNDARGDARVCGGSRSNPLKLFKSPR